MPADPYSAIAAGVGSGLSLYQSYRNERFQKEQNQLDRQWELDMYHRRRGDDLADWNRQNEYNSPEQMMKRYEEAGLNKHLIYGQTHTAAPVRSAPSTSSSKPAPRADYSGVLQGLSSFYQLMQIQAQTENLRQSKELIEAQTRQTRNQTALGELNLKRDTELYDDSVRRYKLENRGMYIAQQDILAERQLKLSDYELRHLQNSANMSLTAAKLLESKYDQILKQQDISRNSLVVKQLEVAIENAKKEGVLKDYINRLNEMGLKQSDPLWLKYLIEFLNSY